MKNANAAYQRRVFLKVRKGLQKNGIKGTPEPSYLRIQEALSNSLTDYKFDLKVESGTEQCEAKLDRNDLFIATHLGMFLIKENNDEPGKEVLQSYPNQTVFAISSGWDATDLFCIYNGYLWIKTGPKVNAEKIPMWNFYHVPETLKSNASNYSQFDVQEACYWPEGIEFWFKGWTSIEIRVYIQSFSGMQIVTTETGYTNKLVFMPFGYLVKNARGGR